MENGAPAIRIEGLVKKYGEKVAVNRLDLEVKPGEIVAFLGPNGAGKTTTIKVITGLLRATEGEVWIRGENVQANHIEAKRRLGYIPDHPYLYEKLSGRDFIHFVGDLHRLPRKRQTQRLEEWAELFGLTQSIDHLIENFSHGMRQKLVFIAALLHSPEVIVVDEPMVGLDPKSARTLKNLLRKEADRGAGIFLSTHQLAVAEEVADRIGILNHGKLLFLGTIEELRSKARDAGTLEDLFLELTGKPPEDEWE